MEVPVEFAVGKMYSIDSPLQIEKENTMKTKRKLGRFVVVGLLLAVLIASLPAFASARSQTSLDPGMQFYVPKVNHGAIEQIADLTSGKDKADADLIREMIGTPQIALSCQRNFIGGSNSSGYYDGDASV